MIKEEQGRRPRGREEKEEERGHEGKAGTQGSTTMQTKRPTLLPSSDKQQQQQQMDAATKRKKKRIRGEGFEGRPLLIFQKRRSGVF